MEDAWMKSEREFFVVANYALLGIEEKKLNKAIEAYNKHLEKSLLGDHPVVAIDLQSTIAKSKEKA